MTTKLTITRMVKTMMPMTKLPLITKLPKASMTWPAASVPSWPCARIRRVEARLSESRSMVAISSTVGKEENSSGVWMNSAVIRISTEMMIEMASADVEQHRRQRQDQHHQDGEHADGERQVAALQERAEVAEAGELDAAGGLCRCGGDVAHYNPIAAMPRAARTRNRQRSSNRSRAPSAVPGTSTRWVITPTPAIFAHFMVSGGLTDAAGADIWPSGPKQLGAAAPRWVLSPRAAEIGGHRPVQAAADRPC